jgi:hypothetical protein
MSRHSGVCVYKLLYLGGLANHLSHDMRSGGQLLFVEKGCQC